MRCEMHACSRTAGCAFFLCQQVIGIQHWEFHDEFPLTFPFSCKILHHLRSTSIVNDNIDYAFTSLYDDILLNNFKVFVTCACHTYNKLKNHF